jgi:hypothetical protein
MERGNAQLELQQLDDAVSAQQGEEKEEKLRRRGSKEGGAVGTGVTEGMTTGRELVVGGKASIGGRNRRKKRKKRTEDPLHSSPSTKRFDERPPCQ